ncbi:MAG: hypothetical protein JNK77_05960 [Saprospiraceae bacterium]|nr:hypothetical protein [Saprospiraceae bacterium]
MKKLKIFYLALAAALLLPFSSCKDEDTNPVPDYETAVHGYGKLTANSAGNFQLGDQSKVINMDFQWVSIDSKNTVTRIEIYITYTEGYEDQEGNPRVANHGTKLYKLYEGGQVPANRTNLNFSIAQADVYNLFKEAAFDYGDGAGSVSVFSKSPRTLADPFYSVDKFSVSWALTTADGRYFDSWSDSICGEFETYHGSTPNNGGFNCFYDWTVICVSDLAGTFDYVANNFVQGGGGPVAGEVTGEVTWAVESPGKYTTTDASFGQFGFVWGDNPAVGTIRITDACNDISLSGGDQYGDSYTYTFRNRNGASITIDWVNTYGDGGTAVLTRRDGKNWPDLK